MGSIMTLVEIGVFFTFFIIAMWHHGKKSYKDGREAGTNEAVDLTLAILEAKGLIRMEDDEILSVQDETISKK